jgi:hypothetical protein
MSPLISELDLVIAGCSLAVFIALTTLLARKLRRLAAARRLAKGLRSYTAGAQVVS